MKLEVHAFLPEDKPVPTHEQIVKALTSLGFTWHDSVSLSKSVRRHRRIAKSPAMPVHSDGDIVGISAYRSDGGKVVVPDGL